MDIEDLQYNESYIKNLNEDEKKIFNKLHVNNNNDNEKQVYKRLMDKIMPTLTRFK
jgi:hypothetical protein